MMHIIRAFILRMIRIMRGRYIHYAYYTCVRTRAAGMQDVLSFPACMCVCVCVCVYSFYATCLTEVIGMSACRPVAAATGWDPCVTHSSALTVYMYSF